ncbi:hypothetical protein OH76DRAFT_57171 [Lentinus brumalis]|uniref:Uncharacterized protein n=1 Tax=Lentinus brumalis TaxID=2498619 RepID=A0A371DK86_9APHY|nr:hypothetical protein OH76DRAFT_57171 [Polyporus brumalis]
MRPWAAGKEVRTRRTFATYTRASDYRRNNDGLLILDVTDPEKPAYCFLTGPAAPGTPEQRRAPLDARAYLGVYYRLDESAHHTAKYDNHKDAETSREQREHWLKSVEDLADVPVLPVSVLCEAWPNEQFQDPPGPTARSDAASQSASDVPVRAVPNLADLSLDVAVKQSVENGDTTEVEKLLWLPGKAAQVKAILRISSPSTTVRRTCLLLP